MNFRWNPFALRYVDDRGRFVSRADVRRAIDFAIRSQQRLMRRLAQDVRAGRITIQQWQRGMRAALKDIHIYSAAAARGGFAQLTARDYGGIGARLRTQYTYLDRFAGEIEAGLPLDGRFQQRVELYAESGRSTYHEFDRREHQRGGFTEEHSFLGIADHCDECVAEEERGWVPIGELVPIGSRQCLGRCHCRIEYR